MDFFCLKIGMPLSYYEEVKHGIFSLFRTDISNKMSEEIKDSKTTDGISDADMKSLARTLLPILREYLLSDEGRKDYDEWKKKQVNRKLNKKEESR